MSTIGQKLEQARLAHGLSVEDVSHETRIHPLMILSLEADDFSRFPSVSYAKSFVRNYGNYLGLDLDADTDALNSGVIRVEDPAVFGELGGRRKSGSRFRFDWFPRRGRRTAPSAKPPILLNLVLGSLIASIAVFYFLGYRANSLEEAKAEIAKGLGLPLANPPADSPADSPADPTVREPEIEANPLRARAKGDPAARPAKGAPKDPRPPGNESPDPPAIDPPALRAVPVAASE